MKKKIIRKGIPIILVCLTLFVLLTNNRYTVQREGYYVYASYRNLFGLDKDEILVYQQYRIREVNKYHNYDTSYSACANDWYIGHDKTLMQTNA